MKEVFDRRITASWCGSRVAGWRIAVVKTSASLVASMASLVVLDTKNVLVLRMKMTTTQRKRVSHVVPVTAVLASMAILAVMAPIASMGDSSEMERIER